jgi:hypothetical protein
MGEMRILREDTLRRPRRRWEDNIKMDVKEIGYKDVHWDRVVQDVVQWPRLR